MTKYVIAKMDHDNKWHVFNSENSTEVTLRGLATRQEARVLVQGLEPKCPVCVYGEPTDHTCDSDQQRKYEIEIRSRAGGRS